jgi:hypothetical protein
MLMTTTVLPILCLMEWNSPKCREQSFDLPVPKFAPNFRVPKTTKKFISSEFISLIPKYTNINDNEGWI